jgi:GNAT superfamily N-acetyltransferase
MQNQSRAASIRYRPMNMGEGTRVVNLVWEVFAEFVAPGYSEEGIAEFKKFVRAETLETRLAAGNIILLAESEKRLVGVIEVRENRHIALFFVEKAHQCQGLARELLRQAIAICRQRNPDLQLITVNSSPNAFTAYQALGFTKIEDEKVVNGLRFIPMALVL